MSKLADRFESISVEQDESGRWGAYRITRFLMTGTRRRRLMVKWSGTGGLYRFEETARQMAAEMSLPFAEV